MCDKNLNKNLSIRVLHNLTIHLTMSITTLKMGLLKFSRLPLVTRWLNNTVDFVTEMSIHGSRIALLHVISVLERGDTLGPLNQTFFSQCCSLARFDHSDESAAEKVSYAAFQQYSACMPSPRLLYPNDPKLHTFQVLNVAREMETSLKTMFKTCFFKRHIFWCRKIIERTFPIADDDADAALKKKKRYQVVGWLCRKTAGSKESVTDLASLSLLVKTDVASFSLEFSNEQCDMIASAIAEFRAYVPEAARPIRYCDLVNQSKVHLYMPWMYRMLKHRVDHNAQCANERDKWRLFALMPVRGYDRCHVIISTSDLATFVWKHRSQLTNVVPLLGGLSGNTLEKARKYVQQDDAHIDALWKAMFNFKSLKAGSRVFAHSIRTDGVSVSTLWKDPESVRTQGDEVGEEDSDAKNKAVLSLDENGDTPVPIISLENKRLIGIDPGKKAMFTSAEALTPQNNQKTRYETKTCSGAQWLNDSGANKAQKDRAKWTAEVERSVPGYAAWLSGMPSTKVASTVDMLSHARHLCRADMYQALMQANGARKVRQQKRRNYIKRQSALAQMTKDIVADAADKKSDKKVVVVFGAAQFQCTGPVSKLRKSLKQHKKVDTVVHFDEFRTSLLASCCAHKICAEHETALTLKELEMEGVRGVEKQKDGSDKCVKNLYSVRICKNCRTIWNRDVNAAINMLELFRYGQSHGGARKPEFSRGVQRETKESKKRKKYVGAVPAAKREKA
jgi:hypothetical protein